METKPPPRPAPMIAKHDGRPNGPAHPIRSDQSQRCAPQYLSQRAVRRLRIMAQAISPERARYRRRRYGCRRPRHARATPWPDRGREYGRSVPSLRFSGQAGQMIARRDRIGVRTGMPRTAAAVHFARRRSREAKMRAFGAPDHPRPRRVCRQRIGRPEQPRRAETG